MKKFKGMLLACDMMVRCSMIQSKFRQKICVHYNILRNREDGCRLRPAVLLMLLAHI